MNEDRSFEGLSMVILKKLGKIILGDEFKS